MKFIHKGCGGEIRFTTESNGCNDPDCCGGITYSITAQCKKCKKEITKDIYGHEKLEFMEE